MFKRTFFCTVYILMIAAFLTPASAQPPTWTLNLLDSTKRSEKFAERKLGSEKMAEKKFNLYRRVVQNNFTHFNYVYNAQNKINMVLERAKSAQVDDYAKLIGYYPYTLENTAMQKTELDSVILKATAGILLHDLRNAWIDDMYLLMGKAYFLRKDFDTAAATFQFINYNLFPRKKNEDGNRVIGTTDDASGSKISIANKEKLNILQKLTARPPSRNDALVWMARTLIEQNELGDAAGLIHTLQEDPNLPKRLLDDLNDVNGYWFYKQGIYDSAAVYLEKGLTSSATKQDLARSEFLLAQLYELNKQFDKASEYYNNSSAHTTDALMDIHAQMNNAKMRKGNNAKDLEEGINNLVKLSKRDKFEMYRNVLFFSAGELAMEKPDTNLAIGLYTKSLKFNENNVVYKNKALLQLAAIAYDRKQYKEAANFYDSLQLSDTTLKDQLTFIGDRKAALAKIVEKVIIIEREDSLQRIAAMDPVLRETFVKKLSKKLRKEKGLKEDENYDGGSTDMISFDKDKDKPRDLFGSNDKAGSEWYFYNASTKAKGFSDFKKRWGQRTNADNWRRKAAAGGGTNTSRNNAGNSGADNAGMIGNMNPDDIDTPVQTPAPDAPGKGGADKSAGGLITKNSMGQGKIKTGRSNNKTETDQPEDLSYEGLMANLPLTAEKLLESNNLIAENVYELGKLFQQELEDYGEAVNTYHESLKRFPDSVYGGEIYFNLSYCYSKLGMTDSANYYKNLVNQQFAGSKAASLFKEMNASKTGIKNPEATRRYESIYNLFIEGRFDEALAQKKQADSLYGNSFWSPQLLYIESVYHVKQKNDSMAISVLNNIISMYPKSALKPRAERMIDVLGRRKEIEDYLTKLQITRAGDDSMIVVNDRKPMVRNDSTIIQSPKSLADSLKTTIKSTDGVTKADSIVKAGPVVSGPYTFNTAAPHNVIMLLDKVDVTYINESKNALARYAADNFRSANITISKDTVNKDNALLIFSSFANADEAMIFLNKIKKAAPEEISWLPANKYSFMLIDDENLQRLKNTNDIAGYKNLLNKQYPGIIK